MNQLVRTLFKNKTRVQQALHFKILQNKFVYKEDYSDENTL